MSNLHGYRGYLDALAEHEAPTVIGKVARLLPRLLHVLVCGSTTTNVDISYQIGASCGCSQYTWAERSLGAPLQQSQHVGAEVRRCGGQRRRERRVGQALLAQVWCGVALRLLGLWCTVQTVTRGPSRTMALNSSSTVQ
jgi:hypothetical protein